MNFLNRYSKTFQILLTEPRQVIDSFLKTDDSPYTHPLLFCLAGAFAVILMNTLILDFNFELVAEDVPSDSETVRQMAEWIQVVSVRASTQFLPVSLILFGIASLSLGAILFMRDFTDGFFDHLIINSYSVGVAIIGLFILIPIWGFSGFSFTNSIVNSTIPAIIIAGIILWVYSLYFRPSGFLDWIRILSAYTTGYLVYVLLSGLASSVMGYLMFVLERLSDLSGQ